MGKKDLAEKRLMGHNDVFANLLNMHLFNGEKVILPEKLTDFPSEIDAKIKTHFREVRRDLVKIWEGAAINLAILGIENQSTVDNFMVARVMNYDALSYLEQQKKRGTAGKVLPVITIVFYFGEKPWKAARSLSKLCNIPEKLAGRFHDYEIDVVDLGALSAAKTAMLAADMREIALYCQAARNGSNYEPNDQPLAHPKETGDLLSALTGDKNIAEAYNELCARGEEGISMRNFFKEAEQKGIEKGIEKGRAEGLLAKAKEAAAKMLSKGISLPDIMEITGLSKGQVQELALGH